LLIEKHDLLKNHLVIQRLTKLLCVLRPCAKQRVAKISKTTAVFQRMQDKLRNGVHSFFTRNISWE